TLTPVDDSAVEGSESVTMTILPNAAYTIGTASAAGAITDNDVARTISAAATDAAGGETASDQITFTVTRTGSTTGTAVGGVTWGGAATLTSDYAVAVTGSGVTLSADKLTLTFAAGATTATLTLTPVDDSAVEGSESVTMTILPNAAYTIGTASASGTITDNDVAPTISAAATDAAGG